MYVCLSLFVHIRPKLLPTYNRVIFVGKNHKYKIVFGLKIRIAGFANAWVKSFIPFSICFPTTCDSTVINGIVFLISAAKYCIMASTQSSRL